MLAGLRLLEGKRPTVKLSFSRLKGSVYKMALSSNRHAINSKHVVIRLHVLLLPVYMPSSLWC